jgi:hypothetical protein
MVTARSSDVDSENSVVFNHGCAVVLKPGTAFECAERSEILVHKQILLNGRTVSKCRFSGINKRSSGGTTGARTRESELRDADGDTNRRK